LQLEPEDLERLRDLSAPSDGSPRAPQLSIPFELTREVKAPVALEKAPGGSRPPQQPVPLEPSQALAVPLLRTSSRPPRRRSRVGIALAALLAFGVGAAVALYALSRLGVLPVNLPW